MKKVGEMKASKYHLNVAPFLNDISKMVVDGVSEASIAESLGVAYSTFRSYKSKYKELQQTIDRAKNEADQSFEADKYEKIKTPQVSAGLGTYVVNASRVKRPDRDGIHRGAFNRAKARIYATQQVCGICGKPVDFSLKYPHPLSPCIDHIIPVAKGGHPSDIDNLQLAHWTCNRQKSDKLQARVPQQGMQEVISNRNLPHSIDWKNFNKHKGNEE